jgi:hypothetical protein
MDIIEGMFYVMKDSTVCLDYNQRSELFNNMCVTLNVKWNAEHSVLSKHMEDFGYIYTVMCGDCGTEYEWFEDCKCTECTPGSQD